MHQQNLDQFKVTIAVLNSLTSKVEELKLFVPSFKEQVNNLERHKAYLINK